MESKVLNYTENGDGSLSIEFETDSETLSRLAGIGSELILTCAAYGANYKDVLNSIGECVDIEGAEMKLRNEIIQALDDNHIGELNYERLDTDAAADSILEIFKLANSHHVAAMTDWMDK